MSKFADLEKVRLDILKNKVNDAMKDFDKNKNAQWQPLRLEKPLLETILRLIEESE